MTDEAPLTADAVLNAKFRATKFRDGYDEDAVDDFLDRVVATLRGDAAVPLTAGDIDAQRFPATKFREGYDVEDVDALMERVRATLAGGGAPAASTTERGSAAGAPPAAAGTLPPGMVDVGHRGLFGRRRRG